MRHVLFMNGLLRNSAAVRSVSHVSQPASALSKRSCAKRPSWKERCLNWYCAGASSVCASSVFVSGSPASSLFRCIHSVNPSVFTWSTSSAVATWTAENSRRPASWLDTATCRSIVSPSICARFPSSIFRFALTSIMTVSTSFLGIESSIRLSSVRCTSGFAASRR